MSSIMRRRSGEILSDESFMALLRLRNEADCLTSQHTKQNLRDQPPADPGSKPPLPRERFSPTLRIVRLLPACVQLSNLAEPDGQGLGNPRGRRPRERADEIRGGGVLWGFERAGCPGRRGSREQTEEGSACDEERGNGDTCRVVVDACKQGAFLGMEQRAFASVLRDEVPTAKSVMSGCWSWRTW